MITNNYQPTRHENTGSSRPSKPLFTPGETRLLNALGDGMDHTSLELQAFLWDELSTTSVKAMICNMRKKLHPLGQDIVSVARGRSHFYRRVRKYTPDE